MKANPFVGRWRITDMVEWDEEYRDLVVDAFIEFLRNGQGEFQFGAVHGWMDCRFGKREGLPVVEFSWDGQSEVDPSSGRGWAVLKEGKLRGQIFIHCSDDSSFEASRLPARRSRS